MGMGCGMVGAGWNLCEEVANVIALCSVAIAHAEPAGGEGDGGDEQGRRHAKSCDIHWRAPGGLRPHDIGVLVLFLSVLWLVARLRGRGEILWGGGAVVGDAGVGRRRDAECVKGSESTIGAAPD